MPPMNMETSSQSMSSSADTLIAFLLMWFLMTVVMMLPLVAPVLLKFYCFVRSQASQAKAVAFSSLFIAGYLLPWTMFGVAADFAVLVGENNSQSIHFQSTIVAVILLIAGLYQFTPFKLTFLKHSRSPCFADPDTKISVHQAFRQGMQHGNCCIGSCGGLMLVLLALGAMSWIGMGLVAAIVWAERAVYRNAAIRYTVGLGLIGLGVWTIVQLFLTR